MRERSKDEGAGRKECTDGRGKRGVREEGENKEGEDEGEEKRRE